ncbi:MAG: ABC transporter permease subunit [Thermostichus sp. HHBFW_bins_43]
MTLLSSQPHPPWWRDERILKVVLQVAFVLAVLLVFGILSQNLVTSLRRVGVSLGFNFLRNSANFGITEGIPYDPSESYLKAFWVGVVNTLWLSSVSIVLATVMGMILGIARLSSNWLARQLATVITEVFRNIPVLLIVIFWYQGVILTLPGVRDSFSVGGFLFISQRGVNLPSLDPSWWLLPTVAILGGAAWGIRKVLLARRPDVGPVQRNLLVVLGVLLLAVACWILFPEAPLRLDIPVLDRFNFRGGAKLSAEFTAMMLGLVTYTGCYIAEVVRGSFLAVQRGQWEASRAIGLSELETFRLVIVPQALRIMIPSLNTQYLTLIKNSSLAIAVGFSDLFNISSTIINQSGRSVEMFAIIMATYLAINLVVSYGMNWLNARVRLVER